MNRQTLIICLGLSLIALCFQTCDRTESEGGWGWKRSTDPVDMNSFLNTAPPFTTKIHHAELTANREDGHDDYVAYYIPGEGGDASGRWGWKRATTPDDMLNFLNAAPPYTGAVKRAEIIAINRESHVDYIAFYQSGGGGDPDGGWGWKRATDPDDVMNFLNTTPPYTHIIKRAEITAVDTGGDIDFIVFYQSGANDDPHGGWGWKKSHDPGDVKNFLGGEGAYNEPVASVEIASVKRPGTAEYYVFYTR